MADVLDQSEVDALLAAVDAGQVQTRNARAPPLPVRRGRRQSTFRFTTSNAPSASAKTRCGRWKRCTKASAEILGRRYPGYLRTIIEVIGRPHRAAHLQRIHSFPAEPHLLQSAQGRAARRAALSGNQPADHLSDHRPPAGRQQRRPVHPAAPADADRAAAGAAHHRSGNASSFRSLEQSHAGDIQRAGF